MHDTQKKKKKKKKKKNNASCSCATDGDTKYLTERDDMKIPVVKETYHTQCVVFMCNRW